MTNQTQTSDQNEQKVVEFGDSPGRRLRVQRQSRGLTIERIATQLHLKADVIDALEQDRFESLPGPVFVMGYLRNYARAIGMNPEPLIAAYQSQTGVSTAVAPVRGTQPVARRHSGGTRLLARLISLALIAGAIALVALWWHDRAEWSPEEPTAGLASDSSLDSSAAPDLASVGPDEGEASSEGGALETLGAEAGTFSSALGTERLPAPAAYTAPEDRESDTASAAPIGAPFSPEETAAPTPSRTDATAALGARTSRLEPTLDASVLVPAGPTALAPVAPAPTSPEAESEDPDRAGAAGVPADADAKGVVLEFVGPSWVQVTDATGARLLFGEMEPGTRHRLEGQLPFRFTVGRVSNTRMIVDGEPFDLESRARGNVARFSFAPETVE